MAQTDEKLIREILKGNQSAMEILVKRHYDLVHSYIYRTTSDYNISYDITQDTFIKMMKNIEKYNADSGKFKNWLLKIAVNTTKDYFKSKTYTQRSENCDIENFLDNYVVRKIEDEKIDSTIETLKQHMPNQEVIVAKESNSLFNTIRENINLVKFQVGMMNKLYCIASLVLILIGTISTIQLNLSIYISASIIAQIPILLGIFEIIKVREENVWELELSYKYSLREIILSRLIIINLVSIITSIVISITLKNVYSSINLLNMIGIWLNPIFIIGSISLITTSLYTRQSKVLKK